MGSDFSGLRYCEDWNHQRLKWCQHHCFSEQEFPKNVNFKCKYSLSLIKTKVNKKEHSFYTATGRKIAKTKYPLLPALSLKAQVLLGQFRYSTTAILQTILKALQIFSVLNHYKGALLERQRREALNIWRIYQKLYWITGKVPSKQFFPVFVT